MPIFNSGAKISLFVTPNATKNEVRGFIDGILQVKIAAPPIKGKANRELIAFLSQLLDVGKSSLNIVKGHTSRNKLVAIDGLSQEQIMERLSFSGGDARG